MSDKNKQISKTLKGKSGKDLLGLVNAKAKHSEKLNSVAPEGDLQITLFNFWENILGHNSFGINDDFFEAGGNSIKAIQLLSRISSHFLIQLETTDIFLQPTISQLAALIEAKKNEVQHQHSLSLIEKQERPSLIPLSFSQERMWFIDRLEGSVTYHVPAVIRLKGELNKDALVFALQQVVNRHETLRTVFIERDGVAYQNIKEKNKWNLENVDGTVYKDDSEGLKNYISKLISDPFDLTKDYMLRAALISLDKTEYILVLTMHHISSDAWSLSVLVDEVIKYYEFYEKGVSEELPELELQYSDYALWQRKYLQGEVFDEKISYWKDKLKDVSPLELPTDYNRPAVRKISGALSEFRIDKEMHDRIYELSRQYGVTLYMTLLAVFKVLLHRYSRQEDICVGTSIANRPQENVEGLIGYFVNTLSFRSEVKSDVKFSELLSQVKSTTLEAYKHQDVPFEKVVDAVVGERDQSRTQIFQVMLVLQNIPDISQYSLGKVELSKETFVNKISKFDLSFHILETPDGIKGAVEYSTDLFREETILRMIEHYKELLESVLKNPEEKIGLLQMLTEPEENQIKEEYSFSEVAYPKDKSIVDLFNEQAAKTSDNTALVFEGEELTYKELNERSNQLAHYLRSKGVKEETLVPIYIERGLDMMVGILGILKSGAAYVPVDTDFPAERISYMLEDTKSSIIVSSNKSSPKLEGVIGNGVEIIETDSDDILLTAQSTDNLKTKVSPNQLAYVIYTSGSTGKPKGVMIEHKNLVDYVFGLNQRTNINDCNSFALVSTIATDLGNTVIFSSLLSGGALHLFSKESVSNIEYLHKYFAENEIECIKIVPSHWKALKMDDRLLLPKKLLVFGGEALQSELIESIKQANANCKVVNHYGPTETTIGKLLHIVDSEIKYNNMIPIGKPFSNTSVYVLSKDMELCPVGVPGQLYISGDGLARGYFNNDELTKEKFLSVHKVSKVYKVYKVRKVSKVYKVDEVDANNIEEVVEKDSGSLMYGTGDLVKYLPDGSIEFIGRVDEQVKIRGYRIELGEIESILQQSDLVSQAVVLAREDKQGNKRLVGYIVAEKEFAKEFDREAVISYLKEKLPEYMIPTLFIELESIPLTANGKIDKKALPDPDEVELSGGGYAAPGSEAETVLTQIWQELLDLDKVGIHDNFFELGGDSIITIQMVSRARRSGYELQVGDVFTYQTISRLSALLEQRSDKQFDATGEQSVLSGECGLLPIQQWYLDKDPKEVSYFNQSILLEIDKEVSEPVLKRAVEQLMSHHDALRFKYYKKDGQWHQVYGPELEISEVNVTDLKDAEQDKLGNLISEHALQFQRSLDIEKGEMMRVVLMQTPEPEKKNRLLIVIHHLAVDGVSWRILLEDLEILVSGLKEGGKTDLGKKSSSYRQWHEALEKYGKSETLISQMKYWEKVVKNQINLPQDKDYTGDIKIKDTSNHTMRLSPAQTQRLIQEVPRVYHTEINDILLSALTKTLCEWSKTDKVIIGMEGHGREVIGYANEEEDKADTSRTVGWFTTHYPVLLEINTDRDDDDLMKTVKEQLRQIPDKGLGYGVLKYINKEERLRGLQSPDIIFNYLGQADNVLSSGKWFGLASESTGQAASNEYVLSNKISVNGFIQSGELILNWSYSKLHFENETIKKLVERFQTNLESLIENCLQQEKTGAVYTPSDFGLGSEISYTELDTFLNEKINGKARKNLLDGLYRLSGLQQGMLFHGLYDDAESDSYMRQLSCDLTGVDTEILKMSWQSILKRHSILRSAFYHDVFSVPVQFVYNDIELPMEVLDFRGMNESEQIAAIKRFIHSEDLAKGFDFKNAPLMRIGLLRLSEDRYRMVWTWHHILFDGWSMQVLMEELLNTYEHLTAGEEFSLSEKEEDRYEDYIRFIERGDKERQKTYWQNYMKGVEQSTLLPFIGTTIQRTKGIGVYDTLYLKLNADLTTQIERYTQSHHITINTLMQGIWSYLLHRYTGSSDVVYGVTVSGRPDELPLVEKRVGMFINTLPLHSKLNKGNKTSDWLKEIQLEQVSSRKYQYTPLHEILRWTGVQGDLFDSILVFENYPLSKLTRSKQWKLQADNVLIREQANYPLTLLIDSAEEISIGFNYNTGLLKENYIKQISSHFENVLCRMISDEEVSLDEIELLSKEEERRLLVEFNDTKFEYPKDKTITDLFEEQAARTPDNVAVVFEDERLTYKELDEKSNQLANYLIEKGVKPGGNIGLLSMRCIDMITSMFGILKSGCAYVPFNTDYPAERLNFIIEDCDITHIVTTEKRLLEDRGLDRYECIDVSDSLNSSAQYPGIKRDADSCVYIMFTSGTTGRPKGIAVSNRNVIKLVYDAGEISVKENDRVLQWSNYSFDGSTYDIYSSLLKGASLHLIKDDWASDVDEMSRVMKEQNITVCFMTTALFNSFVDVHLDALSGLRKILFGGEMVSLSHVSKALSIIGENKITHVYGPTETVVYATSYPINKISEDGIIPIGKPLSNTQLYVLNSPGNLVPAGVAGELYIGGDGVSLGYVNNPLLTQEKFIPNPFSENKTERLYRTGDIVRWLPDGDIEYLGRIDEQVKVRGYRIEPGEIESVIRESGLFSQSVVITKEDGQGTKRLVAYVVPKDIFDKELTLSYLRNRLPEYMIPALWVELESMPLNKNGKTDKKALPEPDASELLGNEYVIPRNEQEEKLAEIWKDLLHVERVGIHDNFFELGGDSIITIQVVSRARRVGYELKPKDIFIHQTIGSLSAAIAERSAAAVTGEQGLLTGQSGLLPIQQWYFEGAGESEHVSYFNQSVLLSIDKSVTPEILNKAVEQLVIHHDALRFNYHKNKEGQWEQEYGTSQGELITLNLKPTKNNSLDSLIKEEAEKYQRSLNIETGEIVKFVLMQTPNEETHNRIFITIHHLAIDGVSWRIILDDLELLLTGFSKGEKPELGIKSSSYRQWYEALTEYGRSKRLLSQIPYWEETEKSYEPLRVDKDYKGEFKSKDIDNHTMRLDSKQTQLLLKEVPRVYHTEINDMLLCALAMTLCEWGDREKITIGLEGHGRENIFDGTDTSRTVGWFTSLYPVLLEINSDRDISNTIKSVKEQLRCVPDKGLGYGVLKYINYINKDEKLSKRKSRDIVFNYLGQLDNVVSNSNWFSGAGESNSSDISEEHKVSNKLSVNSMVMGGELILNWNYSRLHYNKETIKDLGERYKLTLESLISHCIKQKKSGAVHTPSDYGLESEVSYEELDQFLEVDDRENIISF